MTCGQPFRFAGLILMVAAVCLVGPRAYADESETTTGTVASSSRWRTFTDDTPGVSLQLNETSRDDLPNKAIKVTYRILAKGFPQGRSYSLWMNRVGQEPFQIVKRMAVDESGEMIMHEMPWEADVPWLPGALAESLPFTLFDYQDGEPVTLTITSDDETIKASDLGVFTSQITRSDFDP